MGHSFNISEDLYTAMHKCTRCGQCTYGNEEIDFELLCPMYMKGKFFTYSAGGLMQLARALYEGKVDFTETMRDILYLCTTCGVCEINCGVIESQVDLFTLLKKELIKSGIPLIESHRQLVENTIKKKTPYSGRLPERNEWLTDKKKDKISSDPEVFYYVGCVSSYRETEIPDSFVDILNKLDIPFTIGSDEWCCGAPLYFSGKEEEAIKLARHNVEMIEKSGSAKAVFTCPTCSLIFKKYYPRWIKKELPFEVAHVTEYLEDLQKDGKLKLEGFKGQKRVAYHDPCHLGRGQGIFDAPRNIVQEIKGIELSETGRKGTNSLCCGGGGLLPAGYPDFADELALERAREMAATGADILVSSCPACKESLKIASKAAKLKIKVLDLTELVNKSF
ncbi:MAG: (Fe-S)-binding protein [Deltaproteobacteria bacterium]|nr:(Fe-S)-binding protein [Deltaproteobacteria bacterium]